MKKLFVIFGVLAMSAGMAFGQNNDAIVDQFNDGNEAFVDQVGTDHYARVDQDGKEGQAAGEGHYASIDQRGLEGTGSGVNNTATVWQDYFSGTNPVFHTATIEQWGDDNEAYVEQEGNQYGNTATIHQDGMRNYSGVYQIHGSVFNSTQTGNDNIVEGVPGGGAYGTEREDIAFQQGGSASGIQYEMYFTQTGSNNLIQALQQRSTGGGISTIDQNGDGNEAISFQNRGDGLYDQIDIDQNGNYNNAEVFQTQ